MRKKCAMLLIVFALGMPAASSAQTADVNANIIALLTQIIELQKSLILSLQGQIADLTNRFSASAQVKCAVVTPPSCSTKLSVTYDANNCVTAYTCQTAAYSQATYYSQGSYAPAGSCSYNGVTYESGQYSTLDCGQTACWNSGKVYVCRTGSMRWENCGWGNAVGPRDPLSCEGGTASKK